MPTLSHEAPLNLFRQCPSLLPTLLRDILKIPLPDYTEVRVEESDFTQLVPTEYRADLVLTLANSRPVMALIVEAQRQPVPRKRFTWPLYAAALHAKTSCLTCLVVLAEDEAVARWAAEPIVTFQPGSPFVPRVIGPGQIPWVVSADDARKCPELAVLSAMTHGNEEGGLRVAEAALLAVGDLDREQGKLYFDFILAALNEAARKLLEARMPTGYQYQSDFAKKYMAQGRAEGKAEGKAEAVLAFLEARGFRINPEHKERILHCNDLNQLDRWISRAATATSVEQVLDS